MSRKHEGASLVLQVDALNSGGLIPFEQSIASRIGRAVKVEIGYIDVEHDNRIGVWVFSPETDLPPYFRPLSATKLVGELPDVVTYIEREIASLTMDIVAREKNMLPGLVLPKGAQSNA